MNKSHFNRVCEDDARTKETGRTPRHDPHNINISTVHFTSTSQKGRIAADLAALLALAAVAGLLLMTGGAR